MPLPGIDLDRYASLRPPRIRLRDELLAHEKPRVVERIWQARALDQLAEVGLGGRPDAVCDLRQRNSELGRASCRSLLKLSR